MQATTTQRLVTWVSEFHNRTVMFKIGEFYFLTYGVLAAAAFAVGMTTAAWYYGAVGQDPVSMVFFIAVGLFPAVLIGSRAFSVLLDGRELFRHPIRTLVKPGYMLHGGVAGGVFSMWVYARINGSSMLPLMDALALAMPLGHP